MSKMEVEGWLFGHNNNNNSNDNKDKQLLIVKKELDQNDDSNVRQTKDKEFYVKDFNMKQMDTSLCFCNHLEIGCFRIDANQCYNDSNVEPNLLQSSLLDAIVKKHINLSDGFNESTIIRDYRSYKLMKWKYFLTWINKSQLLRNRSPQMMPEFVSFGGLFTSLMMTPFNVESWTLLVCKHRNCIFMNKVRLQNERHELNSVNYQNKGVVDRGPYFASKLTSLITKRKDESIDESVDSVLNEFDKYFAIYEPNIGEHRLLLMNEFDAVDEEGVRYEIKCAKNVRYRQKLLNWWSHCVVADIDYILIGLRDNNDILNQIVKLKTEELPQMDEFRWNQYESFNFVNRFLNHMKDLFKEANDGDIYRVSYRKGDRIVRKTKLMDNKLLPDWFLEGKLDENVSQIII